MSVTNSLQNSFHYLLIVGNSNNFEEVSIEYFEAIASVRFGLLKIAEMLDLCDKELSSEAECELLDQVKVLCTNQGINKKMESKVIGPGIFFLRLFIRRYGFSSLLKASQLYEWIIPEVISKPDQVMLYKYKYS